jgi:outer membrane protein assembly factor BamB
MATRVWLTVLGAVLTAALGTAQTPPAEWSQWRGANRDGISGETGLLKDWPAGGPPLAWQTTGAGAGFSSFSTSEGRLYTIGARDDVEYVMAFDRASGRKLWEAPNGRRFRNEQGDGPRSTPTTDGSVVYALGGSGELSSIEAATGRTLWSVNVVRQLGGVTPYWGYSESPLIVGDRIVLNAGGRRASIVAVNTADGTVLWQQPGDEAAYSSPVLLRTGSLQQVVFFTASRGLAVDPRDGRLLWSHERAANNTANVATPVVKGNRVFFSPLATSPPPTRSTSRARCATTTPRRCWSGRISTASTAASSPPWRSTPAPWRGSTAALARAR